MDGLQIIRTFINNVDTELARTALEAAGIDSMIWADDCGGTRPAPVDGRRRAPRSEDVARAEEMLGTEPGAMQEGDASEE